MNPLERKATPVKLAIIAGQLVLGGAEQQLYYLLSGLDRTRFEPHVINLGVQASQYWEAPIRALNVPIWGVPRSPGRTLRLLRIARILRSADAAVVHAWVFHTNPYAAVAGRLAGVPVRLGSMRESYAGLPENKLLRWTGLKGLDGLITNSTANAEHRHSMSRLDAEVRVVPNGIKLTSEATVVERAFLKTELGLQATDTVIGTIGRIDENKNHSMLMRVFARLAEKWSGLRLVIIGDGPFKPQIAHQASRLGVASKVHLTGAIPGAARYLPAFDVCCLTSYTEGMPNLLMEASGAGSPVVATTCCGKSGVIEPGITGFLVAPDDDAEMAMHVDELLTHPDAGRRMGQAGRARMRREFSVEAMVARMTTVYQDELAKKRLS